MAWVSRLLRNLQQKCAPLFRPAESGPDYKDLNLPAGTQARPDFNQGVMPDYRQVQERHLYQERVIRHSRSRAGPWQQK